MLSMPIPPNDATMLLFLLLPFYHHNSKAFNVSKDISKKVLIKYLNFTMCYSPSVRDLFATWFQEWLQ